MGKLKKRKTSGKPFTTSMLNNRLFYLVKFENGELFVAESINVKLKSDTECTVKVKGGRYAATLLQKSDDKSKLVKLKQKYLYTDVSESGISNKAGTNDTIVEYSNIEKTLNKTEREDTKKFSEHIAADASEDSVAISNKNIRNDYDIIDYLKTDVIEHISGIFNKTNTNDDRANKTTAEYYNTEETLNETGTSNKTSINDDSANETTVEYYNTVESFYESEYSMAISNKNIRNDDVVIEYLYTDVSESGISNKAGTNDTIVEYSNIEKTLNKTEREDTKKCSEHIAADASEDSVAISNKNIRNDYDVIEYLYTDIIEHISGISNKTNTNDDRANKTTAEYYNTEETLNETGTSNKTNINDDSANETTVEYYNTVETFYESEDSIAISNKNIRNDDVVIEYLYTDIIEHISGISDKTNTNDDRANKTTAEYYNTEETLNETGTSNKTNKNDDSANEITVEYYNTVETVEDTANLSKHIAADASGNSKAIFSKSTTIDDSLNGINVPFNVKEYLMPTALNQTAESSNTEEILNETGNTISRQGDTSNFSEYIPTDISEDPLVISNDNNKSITNDDNVNDISAPLNVKHVSVPYSNYNKKHFCIYCKTMQSTLSRHLFLKHRNEEDVTKAFYFPKKSKERLEIMNSIRKKGDFEHNTSSKYNSGVLIVSRQQQHKCKNEVDDYVVCKTCIGYFSKRTIRIHKKICGASKRRRCNQSDSRRLTQYIHPEASHALKTKIFPILRCDEITKTIRYDELVIKFGNHLAEKYMPAHQHDMIRANLRLIGRFIIEIKKIDPDINELKDIYKPSMFKKCVKAIRVVAKWNEDLGGFETPAVAQNLTTLLKKCGNKQSTEMIIDGRDDIKTEVDKFLQLWNQEIPLVNKKANEDQNNQKRTKKVTLPSKDDIKVLYTYLREKIMGTMEKLLKKFCLSSWINLVQATLIFVQMFNRRRAGEIERLTIDNFHNKEFITDNIDKDILKNISQDAIKFAKQFVRISLRGKLGRTVSVLLCPMSLKSLELILEYRAEAGVDSHNQFIFSKPNTNQLTKQYYRACPLLKMFSEECGARIPESLRGTTLRKHIATYTSLLNIEEASVERLANFMGHHKEVHKSIYRVPIPVAEVTCVSKLLMSAVGDELEDGGEDDSEEEENSDVHSLAQVNSNSSSSSKRKRRSTSPYGKTTRCKWSDAERDAISSAFGDLRSLTKLPSLDECLNAIRKSAALNKRTPQQIKSWIHNQRRYT